MQSYLFVDGGYFRKVLENFATTFWGGVQLPLEYKRLSTNYRKCFYYDCDPPRRANESPDDYQLRIDTQRQFYKSLRAIDGWHVFEGVIKGSGRTARQKQIDIQIAVDMMAHSHRRNMDEITFIAGDEDFKPLIDALVREGTYVRLWYEQRSASEDLVAAADARRRFNAYEIHSLLSGAFRAAHPMPHRYSGAPLDVAEATLLERGGGTISDIKLWRLPDQSYRITFADALNQGNWMHMSHPDRAILKLAFESLEGTTEWTPA